MTIVAQEGMPKPENPNFKGDLYLKFEVVFPTNLDADAEKTIVDTLAPYCPDLGKTQRTSQLSYFSFFLNRSFFFFNFFFFDLSIIIKIILILCVRFPATLPPLDDEENHWDAAMQPVDLGQFGKRSKKSREAYEDADDDDEDHEHGAGGVQCQQM